ncbi:hypothetical protein BKA62DRAFT_326058 [Auriculariales sp. MPI-PUGE-AT-0066]|nr:hypothetical protein BKA62DRAFT_326058 [Auriculariales sp. MPI-PUGE-AT-0066]
MSSLPDFLDFGRGVVGGAAVSAGSPPVDGSRTAEASRSDMGRPSSIATSPHVLASPVHIGSPSPSHSPAPAHFPSSSYAPYATATATAAAAPLSTSFAVLAGPGPSSAGTSTTSTYGTPSHYSPSPAPPSFDYSLNTDYSFYGPGYATMPPAQHQQGFDGQTTVSPVAIDSVPWTLARVVGISPCRGSRIPRSIPRIPLPPPQRFTSRLVAAERTLGSVRTASESHLSICTVCALSILFWRAPPLRSSSVLP